ncbi:hypothetical protein KIL84_021097 [Mauremys mutica]|uniref:Uncharacterized protein n=1 Tax=Mauremys mutica TaxID=74926 RepID=A0A9D3XBK2_9SAUR|nr:hypothetical protein KIL84_021097 [Mauremys mutica]
MGDAMNAMYLAEHIQDSVAEEPTEEFLSQGTPSRCSMLGSWPNAGPGHSSNMEHRCLKKPYVGTWRKAGQFSEAPRAQPLGQKPCLKVQSWVPMVTCSRALQAAGG